MTTREPYVAHSAADGIGFPCGKERACRLETSRQ
jgi:hypothetical protein